MVVGTCTIRQRSHLIGICDEMWTSCLPVDRRRVSTTAVAHAVLPGAGVTIVETKSGTVEGSLFRLRGASVSCSQPLRGSETEGFTGVLRKGGMA
jgi:hypothetical protein